MTPDDCLGCVSADLGRCRRGKNVKNAWACKAMGWHETAEQVRARGIREQEAHIRGLLLEAHHQYTQSRVADLAATKGTDE